MVGFATICCFSCHGGLSAVILHPLRSSIRHHTKLNVGDSVLFELLLAPLMIVNGSLSVLVEVFLRGCRSLDPLIGQTPGIFKAKAEVMFAKLGPNVGVQQRAANALADHGLIFTLVRAELIVAAHPYILVPLLLRVHVSSLLQLI